MNATRWIIALGVVLVLGAVNFSIAGKESIVRNGEVIYLELAPVDPRSLMQGDYMALRFAISRGLAMGKDLQREGLVDYAPISIDEKRVARLAPNGAMQYRLRYRIRKGEPWVGTNAFFFEEGTADRYAKARYGEFRLDAASGEAVLVGLRDAELRPLQ